MLTTHYLEEAEALADRVAVIDKGALVGLDTPAALVRQLGRKQIRFRLAAPWTLGAAALPEPLRRRGATLDPSGAMVICPVDSTPIGELLSLAGSLSPGGGRRGDRPAVAGRRVPAADQAARRRQLHPAVVMNGIGFRTLLAKETRRFLKVPGQTLAQPVVTTTLYFLVFGYALGGRVREVDGVSYIRFIIPGLVLLTLTQNAFLNTSSSMFIAKMQGTIVDLLIAPLGVADLLAAFLAAAVLRGFLTGGLVWLISGLFAGFSVAHPLWVLLYMLLIATAFAAIGLAVAIWSDKFEQLNVVPTFVLTPLTFLGGVFYSARMLPQALGHDHPAQPHPLHGGGAALRLPRHVVELAVSGPGHHRRGRCDRHDFDNLDARHRLQTAQLTGVLGYSGGGCRSAAGSPPGRSRPQRCCSRWRARRAPTPPASTPRAHAKSKRRSRSPWPRNVRRQRKRRPSSSRAGRSRCSRSPATTPSRSAGR